MLCRKQVFSSSSEQQAIAAKLNHASRQPEIEGNLTRQDKYWLFLKKIQDLQKVFLLLNYCNILMLFVCLFVLMCINICRAFILSNG